MDLLKPKYQKNSTDYQKEREIPVVSNKAHMKDSILKWQGPEYEVYPRDAKWYITASAFLIAIIVYALVTNNPIMAITFILIGTVGYIYIEKPPRVMDFAVTQDGVVAGNDIYEYETVDSFWIFYEPPHTKILSLHIRGALLPYIHIPIHQEDPEEIRKAVLRYIPEEKQEPNIVDTLERLLHI